METAIACLILGLLTLGAVGGYGRAARQLQQCVQQLQKE
jgi:hypothetical protein